MSEANITTGRPPNNLAYFGLFLIAPFIFVLTIFFMVKARPDMNAYIIMTATVTPLASPDPAAIVGPSITTDTLPKRLGTDHTSYEFTFDRAEYAEQPLALLTSRIVDNASIYLNGELLAPQIGGSPTHITRYGIHPQYHDLPEAMLLPGENKLLIVASRYHHYSNVRPIAIGPSEQIYSGYVYFRIATYYVSLVLAISATFVALFIFALREVLAHKFLVYAQIITLLFFVARSLYFLTSAFAIEYVWVTLYGFLASTGLILSSLAMVNEWVLGNKVLRRFLIIFGALVWVFLILKYLQPNLCFSVTVGIWTERIIGVPSLFLTCYLLIRYGILKGRMGPMTASVLLLGAIIPLFEFLFISLIFNNFWLPLSGSLSQISAILLVIAISLFVGHRAYVLNRSARAAANRLNLRIESQEKEIEQAYSRLEEEIKSNTQITERARIMRDMHDGIGGQLISLLHQVRKGKLEHKEIARQLESGVEDVRLMIASLEYFGDSLDISLAIFRERMQHRLDIHEVEMIWLCDHLGEWPVYEAATILDIYRVMQEATNNALHHGQATKITYHIEFNNKDPLPVQIRIIDNGHGISAKPVRQGRGLGNMQTRANRNDGTLTIDSNKEGTTITLCLPLADQSG
ncbi:MAG: sensor histidine kinase [bacterium]